MISEKICRLKFPKKTLKSIRKEIVEEISTNSFEFPKVSHTYFHGENSVN